MQPINMVMIYYWDKKLKKRLQVLKADTIIKKIALIFLFQRMYFLLDVFRMITIVIVSMINII